MNTKSEVLEPVSQKISVKSEKEIDPKEFFKDREGLSVRNSFIDRIIPKAEPIEAGHEFILDSFKTLKYADDKEIESALPEKHAFTESEVCAIVAELISKQPKGEEGVLLNDGNWNLFYTPAFFVVSVGWHSGFGSWSVFTWGRGDFGWSAGDRVFSPATDI